MLESLPLVSLSDPPHAMTREESQPVQVVCVDGPRYSQVGFLSKEPSVDIIIDTSIDESDTLTP